MRDGLVFSNKHTTFQQHQSRDGGGDAAEERRGAAVMVVVVVDSMSLSRTSLPAAGVERRGSSLIL